MLNRAPIILKTLLKVIIVPIFSMLLIGDICYGAQSQIISQEVEVNYVTAKRVTSVQNNDLKQSPHVTSHSSSVESIKPMTPVQSIKKTNIDTDAKTLANKPNSVQDEQVEAQTKHIVLQYDDVYALSPYAKFLRHGSVAPAYFSHVPDLPWQDVIARASLKYSLSPELIAAVIKAESNFRLDVVSTKGAEGLMQIMPATQDYLGLHDAFNPELNIMAGSAYLREQLDTFGSEELALAAYNAGPYNVKKYRGIPPFSETQNYVVKVLQYKQDYLRQ